MKLPNKNSIIIKKSHRDASATNEAVELKRIEEGAVWSDHVVQDGQMITGQNPMSALSLGKTVLKGHQGAHTD